MAVIKSTSNILGVTYAVVDADSNEVTLANGQQVMNTPLAPLVPSVPTAQLLFGGTTVRLSQANATAWPFTAGQSFLSPDGDQVTFVASPPIYAGGNYGAANTGGVRMNVKGVFVDFTATNMTDLDVPLAAFGSSGLIT